MGVVLLGIPIEKKYILLTIGFIREQKMSDATDANVANDQFQGGAAAGNDAGFSNSSTTGGPPVDDDDEEGGSGGRNQRERRKIEIKFIQDKSRRHITFSKRKAGIMKKAYELSVLTGTQVLLLVVSETGLVYTFTTPKLQPLVTKAEGKNLIQACLNAPEEGLGDEGGDQSDQGDSDQSPAPHPTKQQKGSIPGIKQHAGQPPAVHSAAAAAAAASQQQAAQHAQQANLPPHLGGMQYSQQQQGGIPVQQTPLHHQQQQQYLDYYPNYVPNGNMPNQQYQ